MDTIQTIALNKLVPSKANLRKTGADEGIAELAQSIAAHGLRQNLNVRETETGRFEVVAGGRRFRALKMLVKEGLLAKDADIPCKLIGEDEDAAEISLVENTLRVAIPAQNFCCSITIRALSSTLYKIGCDFGSAERLGVNQFVAVCVLASSVRSDSNRWMSKFPDRNNERGDA
ncbi:MAG: parB-like partition protein, partial [Rhizobium sp.]|nr:parB-like partition protein [Rhizobium sp.]